MTSKPKPAATKAAKLITPIKKRTAVLGDTGSVIAQSVGTPLQQVQHIGVTKPATARATPARPETAGAMLRKRDLEDKVVAMSGAKKMQVKEIIEATLTVMRDAIMAGATLNLPPLGKLKVTRPQEPGTDKPATLKLRAVTAPKAQSLIDTSE